ncbi:ATP-dependent helicase, partial [Patescibacteria group bacterium]|nr:ATP-dependent helicase [Patescibacteria group bacterium]
MIPETFCSIRYYSESYLSIKLFNAILFDANFNRDKLELMENLLQQLNKEQLSAVTHKHGPLLIVAGAGTGKTTVITQRIAYMIEKKMIKPDEILALTFTEKAAGEMEERVDRILPIGYFDLWISTFHGFGERILKEHGIDIGLSNDCKLLNEFEQYSLIIKNLDKFDLDYYRPMGNPTKFIKTLIKHFSRVKDEDISPAEYLKYAEGLKENLDNMLSTGWMQKKQKTKCKQMQNAKCKMQNSIEKQEVARINEVANAYHIYQQLLLDNNSFDFGDLINYCLKLFRERPAILEKYRQKFQFILVDEFQDTNWAQYELIKMLAAPKNNLVVVADDDQAIFRFRGASMSNVLQFQKDYPKSKKIILINNYRSKQNILDLSYKFIQLNNPNRLECQFKNQAAVLKLNKKLIAQNKGDGVIEVIQGTDLQDEVRHVVGKIAELKETKFPKTAPPIFGNLVSTNSQPVTWNDFAILVRANESAKDFCAALEATGLPYQFLSSRGLYAKPIIMDIIAYLKLLDNYHESSAVYRVLNLPIFNFSYQELVNFNYWARKKTWSLYEVLRSAVSLNLGQKINEKINKFISFIEKHSALTREKNVSEIIFAFLNDSGYLKYLLNTEDTKRIEKNTDNTERASLENMSMLNQFMKKVKTFESANDDKTVKAFLLELQMEIDAGEQGALPVDPESGPEAIKIMTVHSAKGLEFKYVFVANMVDKRFPTIERRDPISIPDPLIKEILQIGDIHLEEERRLFYVAMTRAKDHLYFSWSPDYGGVRKKKPSRFLTELDIRCPKTAQPQFAAANWGWAVFGHRMSNSVKNL